MIEHGANSVERFRERFWGQLPEFGHGVSVRRMDSLALPQTGPRGMAVFDRVEVGIGSKRTSALLAYRPKILPGEAIGIGKRLRRADEQLRLRDSLGRGDRALLIATEVASKGTIATCEREGLGVVDLSGTFILATSEVVVRIIGTNQVRRSRREPLFRGVGARILRTILVSPGSERTISELARRAQASYAYTHGVVTQLEERGLVVHLGKRRGFAVRDPRGLLQAWIDAKEPAFGTREAFYAPNTRPEALRAAVERLQREDPSLRFAFTYGAGLLESERFVSGLPIGLYCSASLDLLVEVFGLRRQTPVNFFVLRPHPAADAEHGGIFDSLRLLPHGPGVSVPQLVVDLSQLANRGREQAHELMTRWLDSIPLSILE
jgi:hypothetical protein